MKLAGPLSAAESNGLITLFRYFSSWPVKPLFDLYDLSAVSTLNLTEDPECLVLFLILLLLYFTSLVYLSLDCPL